jgi:hypothetical protein
MSAGTQGFIDTRLDTNHIGSVISRILEARQLAEDERKYAEAQADKYQTSLEEAGVKRGDFFKKALRWKFGGQFKQKKLAQLNTWKSRGGMLKTALTGKSGRNKLDKFERSQVLFDLFKSKDKPKTFRDKFKPLYEGFVDDPMLRPMSHLVKPGRAKKIQKATSRKQRVSKEDILDSLGAITESIQKIAESISEKNRIVSDHMIHSSVLQGMIHTQLRSNGDSMIDKLQKIADAISNQTQFKKEAVDQAKSKDVENKLERQKDAAGIVNFDDLTTEEDESKVAATSAQDIEMQQMAAYGQNDLPKAEQGAIFSGPDSGYPVELHGNEMVVPLDNNYTQGEPSAVDGKVRPKPQQSIANQKNITAMPKYEMGTTKVSNTFNNLPTYETGTNTTVNTAPITSKFGFNTVKNITGIAGGGTTKDSKLTQSMVDVMSLPMMAAGGTILSATTKYMQSLGGEGANINPEIERVARPIAGVFGLPSAIVGAAKKSVSKKETEQTKDGEEGESKKDLFAKLTEGFGKLLEKLGDSINTGGGPGGSGSYAPGTIPDNVKADTAFTTGVTELAKKYNIKEDYLYAVMSFETGGTFDPAKRNMAGSGATGLIQFMPSTAEGLGTTTEALSKMSRAEQLKYVDKYFSDKGIEGGSLEDVYMAVLFPAAVGKPDDFVLFGRGAMSGYTGVAYDQNKGLDANKDGSITKAEAAAKVREHLPKNTANSSPQNSLGSSAQTPTNQPANSPLSGKIIKSFKEGNSTYTEREGGVYTKNGVPISKEIFNSVENNRTKTSGGLFSTPQTSREQTQQQVSSLSTSSSSKSSTGGGITVLNTGGGQQIASAGTSPQPSGEDGTESGRNPTQDFYNSPFSIGVG